MELATQETIESSRITVVDSEAIEGLPGKLPPILILLVTVATFLPVLFNGFVDWDDQTLVNNLNYRGLGWAQLRWMFTNFQSGQYQPLSWITLGLDHILWWMDPFGYHLTSLLLHAASAIGFYFVTLRLLALELFSLGKPKEPALRVAAGFAALIFAIHPLRVEPVAWVSARGDIVSGLFLLWSLLFYLRAAELPEADRQRRVWIAASVIVYAVSLLAQPVGLTLPVILLVIDVYPLKRLGGGPGKWFGVQARRLLWQKIPFFVLALGALELVLIARAPSGAEAPLGRYDVLTRVGHILVAPAFYMWKTLLPWGFSPLYGPRGWFLIVDAVIVVTISIAIVLVRKRWPALLVSWVCHVALLLPILCVGQTGPQMIADRYSYLSCLPWAVLTGAAVLLCWRLWTDGYLMRWTVVLASSLAPLVLIGLIILTREQIRVWHDSERLWRNAVAVSRSSDAHSKLAALLEAQGKDEEAIEHYGEVADINPLRWDAHDKAALLLQKLGRIQEAVELYQIAVQINPAAIEARNNLAAALATLGRFTEAIEQYRKVLELSPDRSDTHAKLGTILALQGHLEEAADHLQQAIKSKPDDVEAFLNLGRVLAAQGNLDRAIDYFRQALRIRPGDAEIHEILGRALAEQGKKEEAVKHLGEALRILKSSPVSR